MENKTVLITGASDGLGRQVAYELAARGYDLALAARRIDLLEAIKSDIESRHGRRVFAYGLDVRDTAQVQAIVERAAVDLGQLDVVIANAGVGESGRIGQSDFAGTRKLIEINVVGAMATIDAAVRLFRKQNCGHVVAISSVAAWRGLPGNGAYSASKAAVSTYMDALHAEVARKNIRTTVIYPGFIDTAINAGMKQRPFLLSLEEGGRRIADAIEAGRTRAVIPGYPWRLLFPLLKALPAAALGRAF